MIQKMQRVHVRTLCCFDCYVVLLNLHSLCRHTKTCCHIIDYYNITDWKLDTMRITVYTIMVRLPIRNTRRAMTRLKL